MRSPRFERVRALFLAALRRPDGEVRERFLAAHAGECRSEVDQLLAAHRPDGPFLAEPPARALLEGIAALPAAWAGLQAGDQVADYVVERPLGRGGFATVYRAQQLSVRRTIALKVIPAAGLSATERRRALREASLAAAIDEPCLVQVHGGGEDEARGLLWVAMRLVEGPDFATVLAAAPRRGSSDRAIAHAMVARCAEVGRALAVLHRHGLVHRDVKPGNVVLEGGRVQEPGSGRAVLVDLGLVRALDSSWSRTSLAGTLAYLAPEVLEGRTPGPAADVFALGVLLFDAVSRRDPTARRPGTPPPWLRSVLPEADAALEAIVARATCRRPGARYPDAAAMSADLERWCTGSPVRARRVGRAARAARWVRENRTQAVKRGAFAAAVVLTAVVGGIGVGHAAEAREAAIEASEALVQGRLTDYLALRRGLPDRTAGMALDADGATALDEVLDAVDARDDRRALLAAAEHLDRDGCGSHPVLVAFLAHAIDPAQSERYFALRLCARVCHDRPDASAADAAASTPLRAALERTLRTAPHGFVFPALGGCGNADSLRLLADSTERIAALGVEHLRLALAAMHGIAARAACCGFHGELAAVDHEAILAAAARPVGEWKPAEYLHPSGELVELAVRLALVRRIAGRSPTPAASLCALGPLPSVLLAAQLDPRANDAVVSFLAAPESAAAAEPLSDVGRCMAYTGYGGARKSVLAALPAFAEARARDLTKCRDQFEGAYACAAAEANGTWHPEPTERGLRLAAEIPGFGTALDVQSSPTRGPARWRTTERPIAVSGRAHGVIALGVAQRRDECATGAWFVELPPVPRARVDFLFYLDAAAELDVAVTMQKGARPSLPFAGEAHLEVQLDGEVVDHCFVRVSSTFGPKLARIKAAAGERRLSLRLLSESTTTLRVYDVLLLPTEG